MFLLAYIGISFRKNIFLNHDLRAAHCFISSSGNVKTSTAKNTKNI